MENHAIQGQGFASVCACVQTNDANLFVGSVPLPAPGLYVHLPSLPSYIAKYGVNRNDDIVTLRQLLDAVSLSSENTEKITKVTNLLDAFLRGFLRRRRVEGHDVVKRGCMVDGVKLFPFKYETLASRSVTSCSLPSIVVPLTSPSSPKLTLPSFSEANALESFAT